MNAAPGRRAGVGAGAARVAVFAAALCAAVLATAPVVAAPRPFEPGSWDVLRRLHAGQPLVVHFWGVTCAPCVAELPEWRRLQADWPRARVVFVQADPVPVAAGEGALRRAGLARVEQWAFASGGTDDRLRHEVDPRWRGELPKTVLVAPDGVVTPLRDGTDFARIRDWLAAPSNRP